MRPRLDVLLAAFLALAGCNDTDDAPPAAPFADAAARDSIAAALPAGWRIAATRTDRVPFEQHAGDGYKGRGGQMMTLAGPTPITASGYYCDGRFCDRETVEALELWILPASYADGRNAFALQALRVPDEIFHDERIRLYALVSRSWGDAAAFDRSFTDASRERSALGVTRGDLALSWANWKADIVEALRRRPASR